MSRMQEFFPGATPPDVRPPRVPLAEDLSYCPNCGTELRPRPYPVERRQQSRGPLRCDKGHLRYSAENRYCIRDGHPLEADSKKILTTALRTSRHPLVFAGGSILLTFLDLVRGAVTWPITDTDGNAVDCAPTPDDKTDHPTYRVGVPSFDDWREWSIAIGGATVMTFVVAPIPRVDIMTQHARHQSNQAETATFTHGDRLQLSFPESVKNAEFVAIAQGQAKIKYGAVTLDRIKDTLFFPLPAPLFDCQR